jgi:hypothetical protein
MTDQKKSTWETIGVESAAILDKLGDLIREGNVRRVIVEHEGRTVAEFPLTAGVVGAVLAPVLAAIGALLALLQNCTLRVERAPAAAGDAPRDKPSDTPANVA